MVPLEARSEYISGLIANNKLNIFYAFINGLPIPTAFEDPAVSTDLVIDQAIQSILDNDKKRFEENYFSLAKREPKSNSPFTNDNILLFVLLCGVVHFNTDDSWIRKVLKARTTNNNEARAIKQTFLNIVDKNFVHTANLYAMIIPLEGQLNHMLISDEEKQKFYTTVTLQAFPVYRSEFLNILLLRSYDTILFQINPAKDGAIFRYIDFEKAFLKRVAICAQVIYWSVIFAVLFYIIKIGIDPQYSSLLNKLVPIFGLIGFGALSFFKRDWVINGLRSFIQYCWGYNNTTK
jgi:hypothetical protein